MTHEAKMIVYGVLIAAHIRLIGTRGPFDILTQMISEYYEEWDW